MQLRDYIKTNFAGLVLKPSLYYQWNHSIHFDLAKGLYQLQDDTDKLNPDYFNTVYDQAISLFNDLFSDKDTILLVTNVYQHKDYIKRSKRKIKVYSHYIKSKDVRFRLKQETLPYMFNDEEEAGDYCTSQISLECHKRDISYLLLMKAICNQDFSSLKPRLSNPYYRYDPDIFFINVTKSVILYIYDDRGCEVIASDIETIRPIYEKYVNWIDEYCREEIDQRFK